MQSLWHVSEEPALGRFVPRAVEGHASDEALVWAIDDEHVPAYWFPRECPRGTWWAIESTTDEDVERFLGGERSLRVHAIEAGWLDELREARVFAYRLPGGSFTPWPAAAGHWVSREPVDALEIVELGDLLTRHAAAGIELRIVPALASLWERIAASTLEFSGIRLRNLGAR